MSYSSIQSTSGLKAFDYRQTPELRTPAGPIYPTLSCTELENGKLACGTMDFFEMTNFAQTVGGDFNKVAGFEIASSLHGPIQIWDINSKTGRYLQALNGHTAVVTTIAALKDDKLASGSFDKTIKLWNVHQGQCLLTLNVYDEMVAELAVLDEDKLISESQLFGSKDGILRLWDLRKGQCLQSWQIESINSMALLKNRTLACGSAHEVKLLDFNTGKFYQTLHGHSGSIECLETVNDHLVASGSVDKTSIVWDIRTGKRFKRFEGDGEVRLLSSFKGRILASCTGEKTINLWNLEPIGWLQTLPDEYHPQTVNLLAMLRNGELVTAAETLKVWRFPERQLTPQEETVLREEQLADDLSHLKLASSKPNSNLSQMNTEFMKHEQDAFNFKSTDFFLTRARFYENSAKTEKSAVRKEMLLKNAVKDYRQVMEFDLFAEGVAERIESLEAELYPKIGIPQIGIPPQGTFAPVPSSAASFPSSNALTPEQQAKVEAIKQQMLKGLRK